MTQRPAWQAAERSALSSECATPATLQPAYLQYSLCRSDSIQRRAVASASSGFKGDVASLALTERAELDLAASLLRLDDVLLSVEADLMPNRYGVGGAPRCRRG